ncbi:MAG: formate dehydrogenase [Betaproteobacteria bacterium]|nr:formate dehydrogenase [Betaproteobacteria bacterium]
MGTTKPGRRKFMMAMGLGATAAAAAAVTVQTSQNKQGAKKAAEAGKPGGYRLTEHIQDYYRTARV